MTRAEIIQAVKVKLEELSPFDEGMAVLGSQTDVKPLTSYIEQTLDEASDEVLLFLPMHLLTPSDISNPTLTVTDGVGYIDVPTDYHRLYCLMLSTWERPATRPISVDSPEYNAQQNKYTRGKNAKPVVAVAVKSGKRVFELYSAEEAGVTVTKAQYIKKVKAEDNPDRLIPYIVLACAAKVCGIYKMYDRVKTLREELSEYIKLQQQ